MDRPRRSKKSSSKKPKRKLTKSKKRAKKKLTKRKQKQINVLRAKLKLAEAERKKALGQIQKNNQKVEVIVNNDFKRKATKRQKNRIKKEDILEGKLQANNISRAELRQLEISSAQNSRDMIAQRNRGTRLLLDNRLKELDDLKKKLLEFPDVFSAELKSLGNQQKVLKATFDINQENTRNLLFSLGVAGGRLQQAQTEVAQQTQQLNQTVANTTADIAQASAQIDQLQAQQTDPEPSLEFLRQEAQQARQDASEFF